MQSTIVTHFRELELKSVWNVKSHQHCRLRPANFKFARRVVIPPKPSGLCWKVCNVAKSFVVFPRTMLLTLKTAKGDNAAMLETGTML